MITDISELKKGAILSETSHYTVKGIIENSVVLEHFEGQQEVFINKDYLKTYTDSADIFTETVEVTKEDKKDGTPGIRTIWENIHSAQVFTVCFKKQNKAKSKKQFDAEVMEKAESFAAALDKVKAQKKGVTDAAKAFIKEISQNPILPYIEGETRTLRGYKIQFVSRDGRYDCVDMDIVKTDKESGIRPVNINTIEWLIFNGIKYVVK